MNVAVRRPSMTLDEFLAWEDQQEERWEFDGFEPQAMVGATTGHNLIGGALEFALRRRMTAGPCRVFRETVRLRLSHTLRYPDLMVVCAPVPLSATEITNPIIMVEILSPGTARKDRIEKNQEYQNTSSIQRYILLEQDAIAAAVYQRQGELWTRSTVTGNSLLAMPEIGVEFPLAEIYTDLDLPT